MVVEVVKQQMKFLTNEVVRLCFMDVVVVVVAAVVVVVSSFLLHS